MARQKPDKATVEVETLDPQREAERDAHYINGPTPPAGPAPTPDGGPIWEVEIPGALIGPRFVQAASEAEAVSRYKAPCGITVHREPAKVSRTDLDPSNLPEGVELFGEPDQ